MLYNIPQPLLTHYNHLVTLLLYLVNRNSASALMFWGSRTIME